MTHKTKGIVLKTVKYGETSLVVTVFTELFGVQTYMVNGVRTSKKNSTKANLLQPAAILDLVVYHHEQKSMQRIKEFSWGVLYSNVLLNVIKNSVALFIVELLYKCLKQPEKNELLFYFVEDVLLELDKLDKRATANLPLFFYLHLPHFLGFKLQDNYSEEATICDLQEGDFTNSKPNHPYYIEQEEAMITSQILRTLHPNELELLIIKNDLRRNLLHHYNNYYSLHIQDFGQLKTIEVLQQVL